MRLLLAALLCAGCGVTTREARAIQPHPGLALGSPDHLPVSATLYIHQRAPDRGDTTSLPRDYQLRSWAQFAVVTRDRLRFHVGIARADEDEAKTSGWRVWLEDETGRRYEPERREVARINRIAVNWRAHPWNPTSLDKYCQEPPCLARIFPGYTAYEGVADFSFHERDLARRNKLSLVLERDGMRLRFSWTFGHYTELHHYGRTEADKASTLVVPGPHTELGGTRTEDETW